MLSWGHFPWLVFGLFEYSNSCTGDLEVSCIAGQWASSAHCFVLALPLVLGFLCGEGYLSGFHLHN